MGGSHSRNSLLKLPDHPWPFLPQSAPCQPVAMPTYQSRQHLLRVQVHYEKWSGNRFLQLSSRPVGTGGKLPKSWASHPRHFTGVCETTTWSVDADLYFVL